MRMGINNGFLQTDLAGNGKVISNLGGVVVPYGQVLDIFIAVRSDGKPGSGSQIDPLDGSTQAKFDAIFNTYFLAGAINIHFHLAAGLYRTAFARTWWIGAGWLITGAGMYLTTIQFAGPWAAGYSFTTRNSYNGFADNVKVSNLTIDCNWAELAPGVPIANGERNTAVSGLGIYGSHGVIEYVRCINDYGSLANGAEAFGLFFVSPLANVISDNVIRFCLNELPAGNYGSPFALLGNVSPARLITDSRVHNCKAAGINNGLNPGFNTGGVNLAYDQDCQVYDNTFIDCEGIVHHDTGSSTGLRAWGNSCVRATAGISWGSTSGVLSDLHAFDNKIDLQVRLPGGNASYGFVMVGNQSATGVSVTDNKIKANPVAGGGSGFMVTIQDNGLMPNSLVARNILDDSLAGALTSASVMAAHNYTTLGRIALGLSGPDKIKYKPALTNRASTTVLANDPDLVLTLAPNSSYIVELRGYITDLTGANGLNYGIFSTQAVIYNLIGLLSANIGAPTQQIFTANASGLLLTQNIATPTNHALNYRGLISTGNSAAIISFQWAQKVSSATPTQVAAFSYLSAQLLG